MEAGGYIFINDAGLVQDFNVKLLATIKPDDPGLGISEPDNSNVYLIKRNGVGDYTIHWGKKTFNNSIDRARVWLKRWKR